VNISIRICPHRVEGPEGTRHLSEVYIIKDGKIFVGQYPSAGVKGYKFPNSYKNI
jgi:hypothetical protein